ncbi:hypothetical protein CWO07_24920 [Vibrio splendidus]|uniref:Uncharacterized protein n=1 Tax=Vibrio splendidus TaxID=29497 RepID=A0A2T5EGR5_VIBSP|nr:hypothetical protein [Vibrio splendidus]PTP18763.1 hypothetical protein CWO07_24920 [Vibrio splendidus]
MRSVKEKLMVALDAMAEEGAKINASAVEKRAGVSNGSVSYYDDIAALVLEYKAEQREQKTGNLGAKKSSSVASGKGSERANISKTSLKKKNEELKKAKEKQQEYYHKYMDLKEKENSWAEKIGNLTMALHKKKSAVNPASHVIQMPKRGRE